MFIDFSDSTFLGAILDDCNLISADFRNCKFLSISLKNSMLDTANFTGSDFFPNPHTVLKHTSSMRQAIMPDGKNYDGRYLLPGDELEIIGHMRNDIKNVPFLELYLERREIAKRFF